MQRVGKRFSAGTAADTEARRTGTDGVSLSLLGRFQLIEGERELDLGRASQRLLALVALRSTGINRDLLAGLLWPQVSEGCAHMCLRSALVRLAHAAPLVLQASPTSVSLARGTAVDLHRGQVLARHLLHHSRAVDLDAAITYVSILSADLLPGWYEDWLLAEAESWRQLRLHALESLADALRERRQFGEASVAAAAAIAADPLRETARAAMIRVHLAEGNWSEAQREFGQYQFRVRRDLAREPTEQLCRLLMGVGS